MFYNVTKLECSKDAILKMVVKSKTSEATKERIILAATTQFLSHGYDQTTTREISKLLNMTQPALYHYFGDKEELFVEVIKRVGHQVFGDMQSILDQSYKSPVDQLVALTRVIVNRHPSDVFTLIHSSFKSLSLRNQQELGKVFGHDYIMPIASFFEKSSLILRGNVDSRVASSFYITSLAPLFGNFHALNGGQSIDEHVYQLVDLILNGVAEH